MVLLALAHLAVERPGWEEALRDIALLMDTPETFKRRQVEAHHSGHLNGLYVAKGQPVLFERFRLIRKAELESPVLQKHEQHRNSPRSETGPATG